MNIQHFIESLAVNSGATHHMSHGVPNYGAFASIYGHEATAELPVDFVRRKQELKVELIAEAVKKYVLSKAELLADDSNYVGGWWENGNLVLDISRHFNVLDDAIRFGVENKQDRKSTRLNSSHRT